MRLPVENCSLCAGTGIDIDRKAKCACTMYELLPTGKYHVSFSEVSNWVNCSWSHYKKQIQLVDLDKPGWGSCFGTAIHSCSEHFFKTRQIDMSIAEKFLIEEFALHKFEDKQGNVLDVNLFIAQAHLIMRSLPKFMDKEFKNWKYVEAEHELYEKIESLPNAFKGFIDIVIEAEHNGKTITWIIDLKTSTRGWFREKRADETTKMQLILYKNYYVKKMNLNPRNVRCGFVIMKREGSSSKAAWKQKIVDDKTAWYQDSSHDPLELIPISVGDVTSGRSLQVVNNMVASINRKMFLKNKTSCKYCPFMKTEHCEGTNCEQ